MGLSASSLQLINVTSFHVRAKNIQSRSVRADPIWPSIGDDTASVAVVLIAIVRVSWVRGKSFDETNPAPSPTSPVLVLLMSNSNGNS